MTNMFSGCSAFNQPLNPSWDVSVVINLSGMFQNCESYNQALNAWVTTSVQNMSSMFAGCAVFNQPLDTWVTTSVIDMNNMFTECITFNQPLNTWDTSTVADLGGMFSGCITFDQPLNDWDTSSVVNISAMFTGCITFNQPIDSWNTASVTDMTGIFSGATSFSQNISTWNVTSVTTVDPATALFIIASACFPANTPITTNQGIIAIDKIDPKIHTIRNKKIVAVIQTINQDKNIVCIEKAALGKNLPSERILISNNHRILFQGKMIKAKDFVGKVNNIYFVKYTGEVLYNILMEEHDKMVINNLIVETMHPENRVAKLYNTYHIDNLTLEQKVKLIRELNYIVKAENTSNQKSK